MIAHSFGGATIGEDAAPGNKTGAVGPAAAAELELVPPHSLAPAVKPPPKLDAQLEWGPGGGLDMDDDDSVWSTGENFSPVFYVSQRVGEPSHARPQVQAAPVVTGPFLVVAETEQRQVTKGLVGSLRAGHAERPQFGQEVSPAAIALEQRLAYLAETGQGERVPRRPMGRVHRLSSLSWTTSLCTRPCIMAPSRPLPTGSASRQPRRRLGVPQGMSVSHGPPSRFGARQRPCLRHQLPRRVPAASEVPGIESMSRLVYSCWGLSGRATAPCSTISPRRHTYTRSTT